MNYQDRTKRLLHLLEANNLDGALISSSANIYYLTGVIEANCMLVASAKSLTIIAENEPALDNSAAVICLRPGAIEEGVKDTIKTSGLKSLGCEAESLTAEKIEKYTDLLKVGTLADLDISLRDFRAVKEQDEIDRIEKAVRIGDDTFAFILDFIKPGMNEIDIGLEIERQMRSRGASALSYGVMVAAGPRSWVAHAHPIDNIVKIGDIIKFDFGCRCMNYCSDLSRTIFVGAPGPELKKMYEAVFNAQKIAIAACVEGACVKDIDNAARSCISDFGFGETNPFALGHGIGIAIHEYPTVSMKRDYILKENMVLSIEPGIYMEGLGGVRLEDIFVVKKKEQVMLTVAPKNLTII